MIRVEYNKKNNYPHNRELILFDRCAFQNVHRDVLAEINKKYNIFCPQVFVMECIAPNNTDGKSEKELEKDKKSLREKLELIENPIVLTGETYISSVISSMFDMFPGSHYLSILTSEEIAGNCIAATPVTMERVAPKNLISYYEPRIEDFKSLIKSITEKCDTAKGMLTPNKMVSYVQQILQPMFETLDMTVSTQDIKAGLKRDKQTRVKQTPNYAAEKTLQEMENEPIDDIIVMLEAVLNLTDVPVNRLRRELADGKRLTMKNYPHLSYPIYIYYLFKYMIYARQINAEHLDKSYLKDFRYLHYLNFCDMFIVGETSTPHIVNSIPYDNIRKMPVITTQELKNKLT